MCGPLSVLYMTKVSLAMPSSSRRFSNSPTCLSWYDHRVVIGRLPTSSLSQARRLCVGAQMHMGGIDPAEEGLARCMLALDPVLGGTNKLVVAGLHAFLGKGAGIFDLLLAHPTPARLLGGVVGIGRPAVENATGTKAFAKVRKVFWIRVVGQLRL